MILQKQDTQIILAESPFGTRWKLFLQSQWAYGLQTMEYLSMVSTSYNSRENLMYTWWYHRCIAGEFSLLIVVDMLDLPEWPDNPSSALSGRPRTTPVPCSTSIPPNLLLSGHSFPTLCCFSSCFLACSVCAAKEAVPFLWDAPFGSRCGAGSSSWLWYS